MSPSRPLGRVLLLAFTLTAAAHDARANDYAAADDGQRPARSGTSVLPETFLRGFDPITLYLPGNEGPGHAPADDASKWMHITPRWPGAYVWVDRKTLQFRPAEPWPALQRFAVDSHGTRKILTTMMSAPSAMSPASESNELKPFRTLTLTFPQPLPISSLREMVTLELRSTPGLADAHATRLKRFALSMLPRPSSRDAATYAITLDENVPEGRVLAVDVSLALGEQGKTLWTGRLSTRPAFHLEAVVCGDAQATAQGGKSLPQGIVLACGNRGEAPELRFSAPLSKLGRDISLTTLRKLVSLEPSVADLHFEPMGARVQLRGHFVPDTLYRMRLGSAALADDSGRSLQDPSGTEVFFHQGWRAPFVRFEQSDVILEKNGPRMLPLMGQGDARADVRIYRVDPLYTGLWPFPARPVTVDEQSAPPFPGEEPARHAANVRTEELEIAKNIRLLGSPLVSRVVDLPLAQSGGSTRFGLDLAPLLDGAVGKMRAGTYLVGLRRLTGAPARSYVRVQVTNLSLTTVEEPRSVKLFVRTIDRGEPVASARITLEGTDNHSAPASMSVVTNASGWAELEPGRKWHGLSRVSVQSGEDTLVLDPSSPPPAFANNHWGSADNSWLGWLLTTGSPPPSANDVRLGFLFTERAIYRPGETVYVKGYVRERSAGTLLPSSLTHYRLRIETDGDQKWELPLKVSALGGIAAEFKEKDAPTGDFRAVLTVRTPGNTFEDVATRTFKIEAYRIPTFAVQLAGASEVPLDAPFKVKAVARYYAGGQVSKQPIVWTVTRRPYYYLPRGHEGYLFASSTQFSRTGTPRAAERQEEHGTLDAQGAADVTVNPQLDLDGSARIYHFEATVTGADNQQVTNVSETRALPPFVMGMKVPRYLEDAKEVKPELIAVGVEDRPAVGQSITVRFFRRLWHSHLRETAFATGEAKYVTEQEDVKLEERTLTMQEKPTIPSFAVPAPGVYVVELTSRDKLGRVQTLSADLYLGGKGAVAWAKAREGVFTVSPDKAKYRPGETARLILQSPYQTARALIVIEAPGANRYLWKDVQGGKAVVEVKLEPNEAPNLPLHVVLMRGRVGEPKTGSDTRYKPATLAASLDLVVEPTANELKVHVAHPETARPGANVELTVTLQDDQHRPLAGEVTLWLVDEAVLSLAKEGPLDPLGTLVPPNARLSSIRDTRNLVTGRLEQQDEEPGGDGSEDSDRPGTAGKPVVRKNFQTIPHYQATLLVGASGKVVVPVKLSDDLTNFRVRAVAASGSARFGFDSSTLKVRLPVLVQPQLPRFVRQGDRFWGGGVGRLVEGAEGPGTAEVTFRGPVDAKAFSTPVTLTRDAAHSILAPVTVRTLAADTAAQLTVHMEMVRTSDKVGDAFEVKLPVLPDRSVEQFAYFDSWKDGRITLRPFPEPVRPGTAAESVVVSSAPGVLELASALDYLSRYPYGCLEQRLSQLIPSLEQGSLLQSLGLQNQFSTNTPSWVKHLLEDLPLHQDNAGFFAYWPGGPGDVQLTATAVEFLADARKAGLPVPATVEERAVKALERSLRSDFVRLDRTYRYEEEAAVLRALMRIGKIDENYLAELYQSRSNLSATGLADLASAMNIRPAAYGSNLSTLKGELWDTVTLKLVAGKSTVGGISRDGTYTRGYLGSNTATLSAVFEALLRMDPSDKRQAFLRDALVSKGSATDGFGTTFDNRRGVSALGTYVALAKEDSPRSEVTLGSALPVVVDGKHKAAHLALTSDTLPNAKVSGGPVGARVSYRYLPAAPGDQVVARAQGFVVERTTTFIAPGSPATLPQTDAHGQKHKLAMGEVAELHTRITTDEDRYQVALVVPFAAGVEPLNPALDNASSDAKPSQADSLVADYVQRLDHEVRYFFLRLPRGTHSFHFRVRATIEGSFVHPAPYAEALYHPEVRGRGEGMRWVVTGSHEK